MTLRRQAWNVSDSTLLHQVVDKSRHTGSRAVAFASYLTGEL
jgi:hypothetical protein